VIIGVIFLLCGFLFVLIGAGGFVGFMHEGDAFGAWFFMVMFIGGSLGFFAGGAAAFGVRLKSGAGSLREAWRAVFSSGSSAGEDG
jgi:hypothetical protein